MRDSFDSFTMPPESIDGKGPKDTQGVPTENLGPDSTTKPERPLNSREEAVPAETMLRTPSNLSVETIAGLETDKALDVFIASLDNLKGTTSAK